MIAKYINLSHKLKSILIQPCSLLTKRISFKLGVRKHYHFQRNSYLGQVSTIQKCFLTGVEPFHFLYGFLHLLLVLLKEEYAYSRKTALFQRQHEST